MNLKFKILIFLYIEKMLNLAENKLLQQINEYRNLNGLPVLKYNEIASQQAKDHSENMLRKKIPFSHDGIQERLAEIKKNVKGYEMGSENVAYSNPNVFNPIDSWKMSEGHKKNLLGNWNEVGVGYVFSLKNHYYTAIFIRIKQ